MAEIARQHHRSCAEEDAPHFGGSWRHAMNEKKSSQTTATPQYIAQLTAKTIRNRAASPPARSHEREANANNFERMNDIVTPAAIPTSNAIQKKRRIVRTKRR